MTALRRFLSSSHPTDWLIMALFIAVVLAFGEGW